MTSVLSNLSFKLTGILSTSSTSVTVSNDIELNQVITAQNASVVLQNSTGTELERMVCTFTAGTMTIVYRGLDQSTTITEVAGLKKEWRTGTTGYITLLAPDIFDLNATALTLAGNYAFTGDNTHTGDEVFSGTITEPVYASEAARDSAITSPTNGMVVYCTAEGKYYDYTAGSWIARESGGTFPNASETVAGKVEVATTAQFSIGTDTGETGAYLTPKPSDIVNKISTDIDAIDKSVLISNYIAGESITENEAVFLESIPTFATCTSEGSIGYDASTTRFSFPIVGNGEQITEIKLSLKKFASPSANLNIRIETDNAGTPSGTLLEIDAISVIAPGDLTTSLADTTCTLSGTQTLVSGVVYYIVLLQGTYGSETLNTTNYYGIGYSTDNTTTRGVRVFNGTTRGGATFINNGLLNASAYTPLAYRVNDGYEANGGYTDSHIAMSSGGESRELVGAKTPSAYTDSTIAIAADTATSGYDGNGSGNAGVALRRDANNYVRLYQSVNSNTSIAVITGIVVVGGSTTYTISTGNLTPGTFRIKLLKSGNDYSFWYRDAGAWLQVGTTQTNAYAGNPVIHMTGASTFGRSNAYIDNPSISNTNFTTQFPSYTNNVFAYVYADGIQDQLLSKTDSDYTYKTDFLGFAYETESVGQITKVATSGIKDGFTGLTINSPYYLNATPGSIGTTPGTIISIIGTAITTTEIDMNNKDTIIAGTTYTAFAADTERSETTLDNTYRKWKEVVIKKSGTYTTTFQIKYTSASNDAKGRIYKNGVAYGTEQTAGSTSYETKTGNLSFVVGDLCQLYIKKSTGGSTEIQNFRGTYAIQVNGNSITNADITLN